MTALAALMVLVASQQPGEVVRHPEVTGLVATRIQFPEEVRERVAAACLELLAGCTHSAAAQDTDWLQGLRACHVQVKFPAPRKVVVNGAEKVLVSELVVTFPLHSTGAIYVRSGDTYLYFAKFTTPGNKLQGLLREARLAE
jgi:hypothetical protein